MLNIVLVNPQMAENIGMIARIMLNFSISNLIIINPKNKDFFDIANTISCKALEKLNIQIIDKEDINISLKEGLKDFHNVFALTSRNRDLSKYSFYINNLQDHIQSNQNNAFLFGRERTGLTNNELSFANYIISINSNINFPSLNLAQAVAICCYEYSKYLITDNDNRNILIKKATMEENQSFLDDLFYRLETKGFFKDTAKKELSQHNIKDIFLKASLTTKDVNILRGIIKFLHQ